jgi:hypothetical protein
LDLREQALADRERELGRRERLEQEAAVRLTAAERDELLEQGRQEERQKQAAADPAVDPMQESSPLVVGGFEVI